MKEKLCNVCEGEGFHDCDACGGRGGYMSWADNSSDIDVCRWCEGTGRGDLCHNCDGSGFSPRPETDLPESTRADSGGDTDYGFQWGPMEVTRITYLVGRGRVLKIRTEHQELEVFVSEKGRNIRVYKNGEELA